MQALTHVVSPQLAACELSFIARAPIDWQRASLQHQRYCETLQGLGVTVTTLSGNAGSPDACFVEDTALILGELAIICSMGVASRRGETALIERELARRLEIARIELPAQIEGGDVLKVGRTLFVGETGRSNRAGIAALQALAPAYTVVPVKTRGHLHLKSACTAINDETLLILPQAFDAEAFAGFRCLAAPDAGAVNLLRVGETVCVQAGYPRTLELVAAHAPVLEIDTSELAKAEGALTCLSLLFETDRSITPERTQP